MHEWSSPVMTPASHAGNPEFESRLVYFLFVFGLCGIAAKVGRRRLGFASIAQLAEHALSKRKVTSSTLVGGLFVWSSLVMTLA